MKNENIIKFIILIVVVLAETFFLLHISKTSPKWAFNLGQLSVIIAYLTGMLLGKGNA